MISVSQPLSKAAFCQLSDVWPRYLTVAELRQQARQRIQADGIADGGNAVDDFQVLGQCLVTAYTTASKRHIVDLLVSAPRYALEIEDRPRGSPLARYQAATCNRVTNLRNETVALDDLDRQVLLRLDGTRKPRDLLEMLVSLVEQGVLRVDEKDRPPPSPARVREILEVAVDRELPKLASLALLVGP